MKKRHIVTQPLAAAGLLVAQVARVAHSSAWPSLENQDPAGTFGDPAKPPLRVVVVGDSSVTAPGVQPLDDCWVRLIARQLGTDHHVTLISYGVGGAKVADVLREQLTPALADDPDILLVSIGGNDALRGTPLVRFEQDYAHLAAATAGVPTGVSGIGDFASIPRLPTFAKSIASVRSSSINRAITRVVVDHPHMVKANARNPRFDAFFTDPDRYFAADHFHLAAEGHRLIAQAWSEVTPTLVAMHEAT
jgi:lysophospholipase L1-like esterase